MPSFDPRRLWRRRNSRKYFFLKERRRRFVITNPDGAALLEPLINKMILIEDRDLGMNSPNGLVLAGDENRRGNNNVVPLGSQPRPVCLPRGFIGSGRIRIRIPANNNNLKMCENGPRRKPIQLMNARPEAQNYVSVSRGFSRLFGIGRLLACEETNIYEDTDDDDDDGADDYDGGTEEEEKEDEATDDEMEADEEKEDYHVVCPRNNDPPRPTLPPLRLATYLCVRRGLIGFAMAWLLRSCCFFIS